MLKMKTSGFELSRSAVYQGAVRAKDIFRGGQGIKGSGETVTVVVHQISRGGGCWRAGVEIDKSDEICRVDVFNLPE